MIHHIAIATPDPVTLARFYTGKLGLKQAAEHRYDDGRVRSVWIALGRSLLMLEHAPGELHRAAFADKRPGIHLLALAIDKGERAALQARLTAEGVTVEHETAYTFYVRDPDGNRIGFSHYPD